MHPLAPVPCRGLEKSASALFRIGHKAQQPFLDSEGHESRLPPKSPAYALHKWLTDKYLRASFERQSVYPMCLQWVTCCVLFVT